MKIVIQTSAGGIVYKKERDQILWLVTQHSQHKGWGFPKGLVGDDNKNEKVEEAALREVREEGGITAQITDKIPVKINYTYQFEDSLVKKTVVYFLMRYVSGDIRDHDHEVMNSQFTTANKVKKILTYNTDKKMFNTALKRFEGI